MRKIMLVIDEYKELVALENLLRRVGFDVLSLGKELLVNDALFRFHPELVIATAKGRMVDGPRLAVRLRKVAPPPRVVLAHAGTSQFVIPPEAKLAIDGLIDLPVHPESVLKVIAQVSGIDSVTLLAKYGKLNSTNAKWVGPDARKGLGEERAPLESQSSLFGGKPSVLPKPLSAWDPKASPGTAATARTQRTDHYDKFLVEHDVGAVDQVMPRDRAVAAMKELKKHAETQRELIDKIDEEKKQFANALFDPKNDGEET
jgi:hypothetical protein